jgi:uncharacterized protein YaaW (UPF0174 family)
MYLKQIYLSKTAAAGCLFKKISKKKKNQKKVKTQKHKNNSRIAIRLLSHLFLMNRIVYCTL